MQHVAADSHAKSVNHHFAKPAAAFTSNYEHWHYLGEAPVVMASSMSVLRQLLDLRTPLALTDDDCALIGKIVVKASAIAASTT